MLLNTQTVASLLVLTGLTLSGVAVKDYVTVAISVAVGASIVYMNYMSGKKMHAERRAIQQRMANEEADRLSDEEDDTEE